MLIIIRKKTSNCSIFCYDLSLERKKGMIVRMSRSISPISAKFVNTHFVDEKYHKQHSQLIHQHNDVLELFYVIHGSGHYIVNNQEYIVQPGSLVVCNVGVLHGEMPFHKNNMQSYCCVLKDLSISHLPPNTLMDDSLSPVLFFSTDKSYIENILIAIHEFNFQSSAYKNVCESLANALLNIVYTRLNEQYLQNNAISKKNNAISKKSEESIQKIMKYLNEHFNESFSLEELGDTFNMSHYYLSHVFKTETGLSPMKYIIYRKIGEAQNLLMNTDMLIGEICENIGFDDVCHFSSMFKKYIGVTPTQYRQYFRKKEVDIEML